MTVTATHAPGTFCWVDLSAHDAAAAKRFYPALLGWSVNDMKYGEAEHEVYTMYEVDGRQVAASAAMGEDQKGMGVPPFWLSYVAVENADETAARAAELGGTVMAGPFDVLDAGRMAIVQDPTGAVFALWQAGRHQGAGLLGQPGALCWNELGTADPARARDFYTSLFGWGAQEMETVAPYTMFAQGEQMVGGMYQLSPDMQMPPCWLPYFAVDDADATAERVRELGGQVLMGPEDIPGIGRFVLIQDPQGAFFYVIKLAQSGS
ncbi:MAG TPA: VOC family protein [Longimicrobium sp.]|jgi:hypothetical protein